MNTTTNYLSMATALLSSSVSIALTVLFMYGLGTDQVIAVLMAITGLSLELGKLMFSRMALHIKAWVSFLSVIATVALMSVSVLASYAALEAASNDAVSQSTSYIELTNQIESKRELAKLQADANQITNSSATLAKVDDLIDQRSTLQTESIMSEHGKVISLIAAICLEIVCCASVAICNYNIRQDSSGQLRTYEDDGGSNGISSPTITVVREDEMPKQITIQASVRTEDEIRQAVIAKSVKPSVRGVREAFTGIGNDRISSVLKELGRLGILKSKGNGWAYA